MGSKPPLSWAQSNVLWLIQQPYRRLSQGVQGRWVVTTPVKGPIRGVSTPVSYGCAESLLRYGLVEPCGHSGRRFQISLKGLEAYRTGDRS